jgi:STE24 endopeptidase
MEPRELRGVLAHEIGHYRLGHVYRMLAVQVASLFLIFWLASWALQWAPLYQAFGFSPPAPGSHGAGAVGLFLFLTVLSGSSLLLAPILNLLSRRHEYQADAYAVEKTGDPASMQSALLKLSRKNLSNLTPHPWYSAFHYSHPPVLERVGALLRQKEAGSFRQATPPS